MKMLQHVRMSIIVLKISVYMCVAVNFQNVAPMDVNLNEDQFTTDKLPTDNRYMCSVGNGHLATDVFSDTVFMNGLYNGESGESHRARIPAFCHLRIVSQPVDSWFNYTLNTKDGVFIMEYEDKEKYLKQRVFAHKFYTRAIVNQFIVQSKTDKLVIANLRQVPGAATDDIDFDVATTQTIQNNVVRKFCGKTQTVENPKYQKDKSSVCIYLNEIPENLTVGPEKKLYTFVMTADFEDEVALKEMVDVLSLDSEVLFSSHTKEWNEYKTTEKIKVEGDLDLSKIINGMWYYLSSSLPSIRSNQPQNRFYGLSPGGLSRGALLKDYQGHSFWDTETWMFPPILAFYPEIAEKILDYRIYNYIPAKDIANDFGNGGIRFPWESAYTGSEVTPDCCPEVVEFEQHITGCIAFAMSQYYAVTGDKTWLKEKACVPARSIADFWASRAEWNPTTRSYDINNVMGPDEDHPNVTNSVFTNIVAGKALDFAQYASCLCQDNIPPEWNRVARQLSLPYDKLLNYNPQFENYTRGTFIKQADVVLLEYPLLYKQNISTVANNLEYYESVTRENGPAMTWSMHTIGHLRLGNINQASRLYTRSYKPYVREPFKIWTEAIEPEIGAVNFITGMGGFLQTLIFGYGGINIHSDALEVFNPRLPPNTVSFKIADFHYMGNSISLSISSNNSTWLLITGDVPMLVQQENSSNVMRSDTTVTAVLVLPNIRYKIRPLKNPEGCSFPN